MTRDSVDPPASFARRYRLLIALGVLVVVAVIMGLRLLLDHLAEQPIVDPYKSFIEQLAAASPEARSERSAPSRSRWQGARTISSFCSTIFRTCRCASICWCTVICEIRHVHVLSSISSCPR
jgi:hypothetical protein